MKMWWRCGSFLQTEQFFRDVQLQHDAVAVQLDQQAYMIDMQCGLIEQLRQDHTAMQQLCQELKNQIQEGTEEGKLLRAELKIARLIVPIFKGGRIHF